LQTLQENEDFVGELLEVRQAQKALDAIRSLTRDIRDVSTQLNKLDWGHQATRRVDSGNVIMRRVLGLLASVFVVGTAIAVWNQRSDVGYVEIKTVTGSQTVLYIDSARLAPIKDGSAILRQRVGTLKLQADDLTGSLASLCDIVVMKNRITTVFISALDRPPRCQCRFSGTRSRITADHTCVS
jgi:hypothetical protein